MYHNGDGGGGVKVNKDVPASNFLPQLYTEISFNRHGKLSINVEHDKLDSVSEKQYLSEKL